MQNLLKQKCVPCEGGIPPYTAKQTANHLTELKNPWEVVDPALLHGRAAKKSGVNDGKMIRHEFKFKKFMEAIDFVNRVAKLAEKEGHHPDFHIFYNKITIELTTHAIKGLSLNDFILASKIESLYKSS